jgi:hypothetical protein
MVKSGIINARKTTETFFDHKVSGPGFFIQTALKSKWNQKVALPLPDVRSHFDKSLVFAGDRILPVCPKR